jgi:eukaryotic-like serine/threonine-protein kinase
MLRVICETQPDNPSAHSNAAIGALHADLDAIVLKALRKEPQERYLTVDQFAGDIQAYLDGRPVAARHGTVRYQAGKFIRRNKMALAAATLLGLSLLAGIGGVLWQARVAGVQRRKAEARSQDLQQLSSSLLSELDEAIKQLPGSTPAQRLLVTRVLEHLDRMSRDAAGDRLSQLDLVDAYTKLGNLQGNPYDQNICDTEGALASFRKGFLIAGPLVRSQPDDPQALRELGLLQQSQSEVLFGMGRTQEAVASMQSAAATLEKLASRSDATPATICEAAAAYGSLADERGQSGVSSLGDRNGALAGYRKVLDLDHRALQQDPRFVRALRGVGIMRMKIGDVESQTDPAAALAEYRQALDAVAALPAAEKDGVFIQRVRAQILRKLAAAQADVGDYTQSLSNFGESRRVLEKLANADPDDSRARNDLASLFENDALVYEDLVTDIGPAEHSNAYRENAVTLLQSAETIYEDLLKKDPKSRLWRTLLGDILVRLGTMQEPMHDPKGAEEQAQRGIAMLKGLASRSDAQVLDLERAARALVRVQPARMRDPELAAKYAERGLALDHRQNPGTLHTLAVAYRLAGQPEKAHAAAREGLALLPAGDSSNPSRIRRLLEAEATIPSQNPARQRPTR